MPQPLLLPASITGIHPLPADENTCCMLSCAGLAAPSPGCCSDHAGVAFAEHFDASLSELEQYVNAVGKDPARRLVPVGCSSVRTFMCVGWDSEHKALRVSDFDAGPLASTSHAKTFLLDAA
jgi:hypothetical protein